MDMYMVPVKCEICICFICVHMVYIQLYFKLSNAHVCAHIHNMIHTPCVLYVIPIHDILYLPHIYTLPYTLYTPCILLALRACYAPHALVSLRIPTPYTVYTVSV